MFPLKVRKLIRGCQAHINAGLSCGADYVSAVNTPLYAPKDGTVSKQYTGNEGGKWLWFTDKQGNSLQFAHLNKYVGGVRQVKEGELIAYTGNTGSITTGPHLHVQILKGATRLDPEKYNWVDTPTPPANTETMAKFPLYQQRGQAGVYYLDPGNYLVGIPSYQTLIDNWGPDAASKVQLVDNIDTVATRIELIIRDNETRKQQIMQLEDRIKQLTQNPNPEKELVKQLKAALKAVLES